MMLPRSMSQESCTDEKAPRQAVQRVQPSINYMLRNLDQPLRVSTLSAVVGISTPHFFSLFRSATGYTPIDFLNRLRIERACELLGNRNLRIKEIADSLGYRDQFYFSRVFKSVIGVAPRVYRNGLRDSPLAHSNIGLGAG